MEAAVLESGREDDALPVRWSVRRIEDLDSALALAESWADAPADAFAHPTWWRAWYTELAAPLQARPLWLALRRERSPRDELLLPWVLQREHGRTVARFADGGITDYNAPLLREGLRLEPADLAGLATALRDALPEVDLLDLTKMPALVGQTPNPLVALFDAPDDELFGNRFEVHERYADWMTHIGKHARKEFERCWRVFNRHDGARFVRAASVDEGLHLFGLLTALQHERQAGNPLYRLDRPGYDDVYRRYLREHLASGRGVVTALMVGETMIAGLFSIFDGTRFTMLRIAMAGPEWKTCAPGKLLLERSIHDQHARGCRQFDFAIGDYRHKAAFRTSPWPLHEACVPLGPRGWPAWAAWRLKRELRRRPALRRWIQRLRGQRPEPGLAD